MLKFLLTISLVISPLTAWSAVIFSDNFDDISVGTNCADPAPPGWSSWSTACGPVDYNGVSKYSGEITDDGYSGNAYKQWKNPGSENVGYAGVLNKSLTSNEFANHYRNLNTRLYVKFSDTIDATGCEGACPKFFHRIYGGDSVGGSSREILFDFLGSSNMKGCSLKLSALDAVQPRDSIYSLNSAASYGIFDGNWHSIEIGLMITTSGDATGEYHLYIDGSEIRLRDGLGNEIGYGATDIDFGWGSNEYVAQLLGPGVGNLTSESSAVWASDSNTWEYIAWDEFVVAEEYIGLVDAVGPARSNGGPTGEQPSGTTSVTLTVTTDVPSTCTYGADNTPGGTYPLTNPMDDNSNVHTATISGLSDGNSYSRNILCERDSDNEANTTDYMVRWSIAATPATDLVNETFEDTDFESRGWYDEPDMHISTTEHAPVSGSTSSGEYHWQDGATGTDGGGGRIKFTPSDAIDIDFWVKYSDNWVGSGQPYHPHEINIVSSLDNDYAPLANNYLNFYIEESALTPRLAIQDSMNVNESYGSLPNDISDLTEERSVAHCNSDVPSATTDTCYDAGGYWYSSSIFDYSSAAITAGDWHHVVVTAKMNTIRDGIGQSDGVMQYRLDGVLLIDNTDLVYRTAENSDMQFSQLAIAPYIGDGSPVAQTMWLDNLTVKISDYVPPTGCVNCVYLDGPGRVDLN